MNFDAVIIGAGLSGLVAAYRLKAMGRHVCLLEASARTGGVIQSEEVEGFLLERGPNSLRGTHEFLELMEELKLNDELVVADPRAPAYVFADGRLQAVPMSPPALLKTKLLSAGAKLRLLGEPFIAQRKGQGEESIASFVRRRLGAEPLERLVAPFLSGIYAGDPAALSVQACFPRLAEFEAEAGSVVRGAIRAGRKARGKQAAKPSRSLRPYRLCSFRGGLGALPQALAQRLGASLLTEARALTLRPGNSFALDVEAQGQRENIAAQTIIIATPAPAAARLLAECAPEVAALLAEIPYVSLASVPLAYRTEQFTRPLDGFGFLAPRSEGLRTLGSIWNTALFTDRAPAGWALLTNYIGGATDPAAVDLSDDELRHIVHTDLRRVLGITGEPRALPITRYQQAIPQYNLGHAARVAHIAAQLNHHPGLFLAGNYLHGVSLGDCIKQAEGVAAALNTRGKQ